MDERWSGGGIQILVVNLIEGRNGSRMEVTE